jgi:hypothetical protein
MSRRRNRKKKKKKKEHKTFNMGYNVTCTMYLYILTTV